MAGCRGKHAELISQIGPVGFIDCFYLREKLLTINERGGGGNRTRE